MWNTLQASAEVWNNILQVSAGVWNTLQVSAGVWNILQVSAGVWNTLRASGTAGLLIVWAGGRVSGLGEARINDCFSSLPRPA